DERSGSEYTATVPMPSSRSVRNTRTAISPRLATSTFENNATGRIFCRAMTPADQLTLARALSVPLVVLLYVWDFPHHPYWATVVFVVAMTTDWFDGRVARWSGRTSPLGSLLDPIADKLLVLSVLIVLIGEDVFAAWMVAAIVAREFLVSGLRLAALERGVVLHARDLGKLKTWSQAIAAGIGGLVAAGVWSTTVAWWALIVALVMTWVSGLDYARLAPSLLRGRPVAS